MPSEVCPIAVFLLTYNEEPNLRYALRSVVGWAREVFVVDSFSTDRTVEIVREYEACLYQHAFETVGQQRNWALDHLPIEADWILFLDADEYLSEGLKTEITQVLKTDDRSISAYVTPIQFMYLGRWLRHGDLYRNVIRMVRKGKGRYADIEGFHEKLAVTGRVGRLESFIVHDDHHSVGHWIEKQMPRITIDAHETARRSMRGKRPESSGDLGPVVLEGGRNRWLRQKVTHLPGPLRPFVQFSYRYILRLGFLDGWQGFVYHFLLQFWYPFMVEVLALEIRYRESSRRRHRASPDRCMSSESRHCTARE